MEITGDLENEEALKDDGIKEYDITDGRGERGPDQSRERPADFLAAAR